MIENTVTSVVYTADGTQTTWSIPFPYGHVEDVKLFVKVGTSDIAPVASNLFSIDTELGTITYPLSGDPLAANDKVIIMRITSQTQEETSTLSSFKSQDIERMADKLTMEVQELQEQLSRCIAYNPVDAAEGEVDAQKYIDDLTDLKTQATTAASTATAQASIATSQASIATTKASEAATSAQNAATSETNAAASAAAAYTSEQHTIQNEELLQEYVDQAEASATASTGSATAAATSATQAATSATTAVTNATQAQTSASNASTQATNAASSATAAASSANTASGYATAAQSAASTATEKANAASQSATSAAASATSAGTSADNAAASALAASTSATAAQDALAEVQSYRRIDRTYIAGTAIDDYTGSLTVFDLGLDFDLADYVVDVLVNGKGYQGVKAPVDFTISGDVVTFVEAVPVGAIVQFRINASTTVIIAGSVDVDAKIAEHNTSTTAHSDIRTALTTHTGNANIHVTSSDKSNWNAKQAALSTDQIAATNSGVTASKVSSYDTHVADTDIHVTVSDKATWNGKQSALSTTQLSATNSGITSAKVSGYDTHVANGDIHVTAAQKTTWNGKQDTISDLATIRSGAAAGATAVQPSQLASVATSGSYNDLSNKPTIPDVTNKANTDLSNITNTGTSTAAGWAMPSSSYDTLTVGASGTYYTAPANGFFCASGVGTSSSMWIELVTNNNGLCNGVYGTVNWDYKIYLPVRKGKQVKLNYNAINFDFFRFYYAVGSESEAN